MKHVMSSVYVQLTSCDRLDEKRPHGLEDVTQFKQTSETYNPQSNRSIRQFFVGTNDVHIFNDCLKCKSSTPNILNSPSIYVASDPDLIMNEPEEEHSSDVNVGQDDSSDAHQSSTCVESVGACKDSVHIETKVSKFNVVLSKGTKDNIFEVHVPLKSRIIRTMSRSDILKENSISPTVSIHPTKAFPLNCNQNISTRPNLHFLKKSESSVADNYSKYMHRSNYLSPQTAHDSSHLDKHYRHKSEPSGEVFSQSTYQSSLSIDFKSHNKPMELCSEPSQPEPLSVQMESTSSNDQHNFHRKLSQSMDVSDLSAVDEVFQQEKFPVYKYNLDKWLQTVLKVNELNPSDSFSSLSRTSSVSSDWPHTRILLLGESFSCSNISEDINLLKEDFICDSTHDSIPLHSSPIVSPNISPKHNRTVHYEKHSSKDSQQTPEISSQTELVLRPPRDIRQFSSSDNSDDNVSKDHQISIYVTDDASDSMFSDSFFTPRSSIQFCDDDVLLKHHSLSPRSSFGSIYSTRSSNADSAVDFHNPDDELADMTLTSVNSYSHLSLTKDLTQDFYNISKYNRQDSNMNDQLTKTLSLPPFVITDHSSSDTLPISSDSSIIDVNSSILITQETEDLYLSDFLLDETDENTSSPSRQLEIDS